MQLDLSSLEKALAQLIDALNYCNYDLAKNDMKLALHLRAAAIQTFEFTYEVSLKMIKRYLNLTDPNPNAIEELTFNELIRKAYGMGLIKSELVVWKEYRKERGNITYTYDEEKAQAVFDDIPAFLCDAQFLLDELKRRLENNFD